MINSSLHLPNPALLTDFYQVSMAYALFLKKRAEMPAIFHIFFRQAPFKSQFAVVAGISEALEYVEKFKFDDDSLNYLASLKIFNQEFIKYLKELSPKLDIHGACDGDIIFAHEPIMRIEGPLALCLLLETPLLTIINFHTLIATKAARIKEAALGKKVIDFGLRRAQGFNGAISATKAAYIGGIDATSNIWAAKHLDIPLSGSMSHSFVMSFEHEAEAFDCYADACTDSCILLCDTYDTLQGIELAIKKLRELKKQQRITTLGIRLDSGDLLNLSKKARALLNKAGLNSCLIVASSDLDEYEIARLNKAQAPIDVFGVGTRLICAHNDPALGGVNKLAAIYDHGHWRHTYKISNDPAKTTLPGPQAVMRFMKDGLFIFDQIFDPQKALNLSQAERDAHYEEILLTRPLMKEGKITGFLPTLQEAQKRTQENLHHLALELKKLDYNGPHYSVIIDSAFHDKKARKKEEG